MKGGSGRDDPLPPAVLNRPKGLGWDRCWVCQKPSGVHGFVCDWEACKGTICRTCLPRGQDRTAWCPKHTPPPKVSSLGWVIDPRTQHPGREPFVGEDETRIRSLPEDPDAVNAKTWLESTRRRVCAIARDLEEFVQASTTKDKLALAKSPADCVRRFLARRVQSAVGTEEGVRPGTVATWARNVQSAYPFLYSRPHATTIDNYVKGVQAMAPNPVEQERENQRLWDRALKKASQLVKMTRAESVDAKIAAAVYVAILLQQTGFRPRVALRASTRAGIRRFKKKKGATVLEIGAVIDKDNKLGLSPAPRLRWFPDSPFLRRVIRELPLPNSRKVTKEVERQRKLITSAFGVRDLRSSRRNAAEEADDKEIEPGPVLNHRPGSFSTPRYVGRCTPAKVLRSLMPRTG